MLENNDTIYFIKNNLFFLSLYSNYLKIINIYFYIYKKFNLIFFYLLFLFINYTLNA